MRPYATSAPCERRRATGASRVTRAAAAAVLMLVGSGCSVIGRGHSSPIIQDAQRHDGAEGYASWFGDTDGRIFYFGLSAFLETTWRCEQTGGTLCPLRDLDQPGEHLIGRFDLVDGRFLPPLRVRPTDPAAPSSVWDVLVHSNGRIYYTTFWDEFGSVRPDGRDVRYAGDGGQGLNELWEGPGGEIYATRYLGSMSGDPDDNGAVVVFGPDGDRRREFPFRKEGEVFVCPRSLAVDPRTGDIWVNADRLTQAGASDGFETFRLAPDGTVRERITEPVIAFTSFEPNGRGWFVEDDAARFAVRIVETDGRSTRLDLGPHGPIDVAQDVTHAGDVTLITTWALTVYAVRVRAPGDYEVMRCAPPSLPAECPLGAAPLAYTAVLAPDGNIYASVACGITVVRIGALDCAPAPAAPTTVPAELTPR